MSADGAEVGLHLSTLMYLPISSRLIVPREAFDLSLQAFDGGLLASARSAQHIRRGSFARPQALPPSPLPKSGHRA